ncbi:hypothetical protein GUJ93_ZPchr0006g40947 [Zizania palustris]|uniref:Glutamate decarboxylase n=1 Tax=Zizania palustris TaxID=103762 RepID=A0A8J5SLL8_ZIZPA|nr:hypothetical protein GUJ93_ZPchr0006g40947 [Zizania palustris]
MAAGVASCGGSVAALLKLHAIFPCRASTVPASSLRRPDAAAVPGPQPSRLAPASLPSRPRRPRAASALRPPDAASGGFIAMFLYPELEWDFRLPWVKSINVSGHKYSLVYAGIGWCIWRNKEDLPEELIFHINYLGVDQPTFTLNFSKGSSQVIAQYYQLIRHGFEGYRNIMENCHENAMVLKEGLEKTGRFNIVSKDEGVPLVAFSLKDRSRHDEFEISDMLRRFGWIVPAYTMPPDAQHVTVLCIVIREEFSRTLAERLVLDIEKVMYQLDALPSKLMSPMLLAKTAAKRTELKTQRSVTDAWRKFVLANKTNGVC